MDDSERFWNNVERTPDHWLWKGSTSGGYGSISIKGKKTMAHRYSYEEVYGPIPDGLHIDHLCGITRCVKPSHLEAVTPTINNQRRRNVSRSKKLRDKEDLAIRAAKYAERRRFRKSFFE
jgi:hypothetical protein